MTRRGRKPNPVQDLMLSYRAEAAEQERWLADITAALGLPAGATQAERVERARALVACVDGELLPEEEAPKVKGDPGVCRKCGATSDPGCEIEGIGCCWHHDGETICSKCEPPKWTT